MERLDPDVRRAAILAGAQRVIAERGFTGATSGRIAEDVGVRRGLLHHYFGGHDELLAAAFEDAAGRELAQLEEALADCATARERLETFVFSYAPLRDHPQTRLWVDAWGEAARTPAVASVATRLSEAWLAFLSRILDEGASSGEVECDDPEPTAQRIIVLLDGMAVQLRLVDEHQEADLRRLVYRECLSCLRPAADAAGIEQAATIPAGATPVATAI